jgi:hypothetical protein
VLPVTRDSSLLKPGPPDGGSNHAVAKFEHDAVESTECIEIVNVTTYPIP